MRWGVLAATIALALGLVWAINRPPAGSAAGGAAVDAVPASTDGGPPSHVHPTSGPGGGVSGLTETAAGYRLALARLPRCFT